MKTTVLASQCFPARQYPTRYAVSGQVPRFGRIIELSLCQSLPTANTLSTITLPQIECTVAIDFHLSTLSITGADLHHHVSLSINYMYVFPDVFLANSNLGPYQCDLSNIGGIQS
jgi:hypothetical protein